MTRPPAAKSAFSLPPLEEARRAALAYSLSQSPLFTGLADHDLERLSGYCRVEPVARGGHLFRQGDAVRGFFIVRTGLIHVYRHSEEGGEQAIHFLRPGDSFAERAMISETGYPANARALEESEVILIPAAEFHQHQRERPDLGWRMLSSMSHHLRSLVAQLEGLRYHDVERRLIHWLLQRAKLQEHDAAADVIQLSITQTALASELGARRETLSRTFRKLHKEGLLTLSKGKVTLHAPDQLQNRLAE